MVTGKVAAEMVKELREPTESFPVSVSHGFETRGSLKSIHSCRRNEHDQRL